MDFFKSVFSDSTPSPSPPSTPNSQDSQTPTTSWGFGSNLFKTIASKSESLLDNYYKDLQEFSSGLKKETSVIRQAASQAVQDLPARLESGAAIAQESLEAVGQAIDNVGSTVSQIIGKDLNFASSDGSFYTHLDGSNDNAGKTSHGYGKDSNFVGDAKPYSRIEAMIRGLQCNIRTYCDEVEEIDFGEWKMGFRIEEKREEIEKLVAENGVIKEIFDEIVPGKVDEETFWCRYFYRADKLIKAEEARARIVKKAILAEEEEELSWDVYEDGNNSEDEVGKEVVESGNKIRDLSVKNGEKGTVKGDEDEAGVSGMKSGMVDEDNVDEVDKAVSEGKTESDFSVISSQRTSHAEDDFGWDEIEYIGSGEGSKVNVRGSPNPIIRADLHKRLSAAEEDEELTWDIEDDEEPVKS